MKTNIATILVPVISGILAVLVVLFLFNVIVYGGDILKSQDNGFLTLFVPIATLFALAVQYLLTIPFWKKFKIRTKVWGLNLIQFTGLLCIISGVIFGLVFWERNFGPKELILVSLTGIVAFAIYWTVNLLILKHLDKQ
ncbi:MAG: hypothetical protein WBJ84_02390 [Bacteroidales bacterium]